MAKMMHENQIRTADVLGFLAGAWLVIAPVFVTFGSTTLVWSSVITGGVIMVLAALREYRPSMVWPEWVNMLAGAWAIVAPFVFAGATTSAKWASVVGGISALVFATWSVEATEPVLQSHA